MIYEQLPENFSPLFEVVSCFLEVQGKILLLLRENTRIEGGKWGVPAGKVDKGESLQDAVERETSEETGISLHREAFRFVRTVYVEYPDFHFVFHIFYTRLDEEPSVVINKREHSDFCWKTPQEALEMPLVLDEDACIRMFYGKKLAMV